MLHIFFIISHTRVKNCVEKKTKSYTRYRVFLEKINKSYTRFKYFIENGALQKNVKFFAWSARTIIIKAISMLWLNYSDNIFNI